MIKSPKTTTIEEFFSGQHTYHVPKYQRSFSWDEKEVFNFWDDARFTFNNKHSHFFGFILLKQSHTDRDAEIIDGQQRLVTVTILLACIRDLVQRQGILDIDFARVLQDYYIGQREMFDDDRRRKFKLKLNKYDDHYFKTNIQEMIPPKDQDRWKTGGRGRLPAPKARIKKAYEVFETELNNELKKYNTKEEKKSFLKDLTKHFVQNFEVLVTYVDDLADAYTIFETLNDRGIELSTADLLKNYLFSRADEGKEDFEKVENYWDDFITTLSSPNDSQIQSFLRHYWISQSGPLKEDNLYRLLRDYLKNKKEVLPFVKDISEEAKTYFEILNPSERYWKNKDIVSKLNILNTLRVRQVLPLLLSGSARLEDSEFLKLLEASIKLSFRYSTISNENPNRLEDEYGKLALELRNKKIKLKDIMSVFKKLSPDRNVFINSFRQKEIKNSKLAKYILAEIAARKDQRIFKEYDIAKDITLEHVMPRKPAPNTWGDYDKDLVYRIGNLTLLGPNDNKKASNKSFKAKCKEVYSRSSIGITNSLCHSREWNEKQILEREEQFADIADKIWEVK